LKNRNEPLIEFFWMDKEKKRYTLRKIGI